MCNTIFGKKNILDYVIHYIIFQQLRKLFYNIKIEEISNTKQLFLKS